MNITRALAAAITLVAVCQSPATATAREGALSWGDCPGGGGAMGMRCVTLRVPVDWSKPGGRTIELKLGRLAATGSRPARGTVLANFGAGAPGIAYLRDVPGVSTAFTQLRQSMDIVTWDPRGYTNGYSTHLPCQIKSKTDPELPDDQAGFDRIAAGNRADAAPCHDPDPQLFDSIGSVTHARDMEAIRRALGESKINLFMGSYGGTFGQAYAHLFPKRIRTMVLDGTGNMSDPEKENAARARDSERRLRRFIAWCADEPSCVLRGKDVPRLWQDLVAQADRVPLQPGGFDGVQTAGLPRTSADLPRTRAVAGHRRGHRRRRTWRRVQVRRLPRARWTEPGLHRVSGHAATCQLCRAEGRHEAAARRRAQHRDGWHDGDQASLPRLSIAGDLPYRAAAQDRAAAARRGHLGRLPGHRAGRPPGTGKPDDLP